MSTGWLFGIGVLVSILVAVGLALPVYGAILDGRYQAEHDAAEVLELPTRHAGRSPAA
jgi:capsular polysaccharide biosynthesis protein